MTRLRSLFVAAGLVCVVAGTSLAQQDARQAFAEGKALFAKGQFAEARDRFEAASKTDVRNPEVFLYLGRAHYQLGELSKAIEAWRKTTRLAPGHPYAKKMLLALRQDLHRKDDRVQLAVTLVESRLHKSAITVCRGLLQAGGLTDAQRAKTLLLYAKAQFATGGAADPLAMVHELRARFAQHVSAADLDLLEARIDLRFGGERLARGLAALKKIAAQKPPTPQTATAQWELIQRDLAREATAATAARLQQWCDANRDHVQIADARGRLLDTYLTLAGQEPTPKRGAKLGANMTAAVKVGLAMIATEAAPGRDEALARKLLTSLNEHYAKHGAYQAAQQGAGLLAAAALPGKETHKQRRWQATWQGQAVLRDLAEQAAGGRLPTGAKLPRPLADVVAGWGAVTRSRPGQPADTDLAQLAERVRGLASHVPAAPSPKAPKAPLQWAAAIAQPVVKAGRDPAAVKQAVSTLSAIVTECQRLNTPEGRTWALAFQEQLAGAMDPRDEGAWISAHTRLISLLADVAGDAFDENVRTGKDALNAKLTPTQGRILKVMASVIARSRTQAPAMLKLWQSHLGRWMSRGHWAAAEQALEQFAAIAGEPTARGARLAVAELWTRQVRLAHDRLLAAGLTVPRKLDPLHIKALARCYTLQAGLKAEDPALTGIRRVWDSVVRHYKSLEYYDVAAAALKVRPAPPGPGAKPQVIPEAEAYAALQAAAFAYEQARRELDRQLAEYGAADKIKMTPAFRQAAKAYLDFLQARPTHRLAPRAVSALFSIAQVFEQHKAWDVAVGLYKEYAAAMAKIPPLAQAAPGEASQVERAEFAVIAALRAKATHALAEATKKRQPGEAPPAKILPEHAAAIAACRELLKARDDSLKIAAAIAQIQSIALEYANVGAWDAAEGIFADLLKAGLTLRRPERLELCRGLCHVGKVLPDHARKVLTALVAPPRPGSGPRGRAALAMGWKYEGYADDFDEAKESGAARPARKPKAAPAADAPSAASGPVPAEPVAPSATTPPMGTVGGGTFVPGSSYSSEAAEEEYRKSDMVALAAIRKQNQSRATRIAALREQTKTRSIRGKQGAGQQQAKAPDELSEAELARQAQAIDAAYKVFQGIRKNPAWRRTTTAQQAREETLVLVGHWRTIRQWQRAAELTERFLTDNPSDPQLPSLRLSIARDYLTLASRPIAKDLTRHEMLAEVAKRFATARAKLQDVLTKLPEKETATRQQAQWEIATSWLTQARAVGAFSATLSRGQFVRAAKELLALAREHHDHPQVARVPNLLWSISQELAGRSYWDEAIALWSDLTIRYPTNPQAQQAALQIAQTYQTRLGRPLKAAEAYLELNFARGGSDRSVQDKIYQIGTQLKAEKRWVEALHVLEVFVDSFPRHPSAGQALTMVGQIHQTNEAWEDAIAAFRRVMQEYPTGTWVREAKWAIAECTINLSRWREASRAYTVFLRDHTSAKKGSSQAAQVAEATRRIGVLKDLVRYQALVDEKGQRKAFDAQYQIAQIVLDRLSNRVKAIIEFRKVATRWPASHLADDAMYQIGQAYLAMGRTDKARDALLAVAEKYPNSPLADDALLMVGQSFENEAHALAGVTRESTLALNKDVAQKKAYQRVQSARRQMRDENLDRIAALRKGGQKQQAELEVARGAYQQGQYNLSNTALYAEQAQQDVAVLTATQLADRQDKINAALRRAVEAYTKASAVPAADKAGDALLKMATIYADRLKDSEAAMKTYLEIVRQFSGTSVAEDASWRIAQYYEGQRQYDKAIDAYKAFLRNYRRSPKAGAAQFAVAENYEHLGKWVEAMDAYTNYINNFASGPLVQKAKEQINWIKTYRL